MDLNFTADELAFRQDIRQWVAANLPADISHKVRHALRLTRDDLQRLARLTSAMLVRSWASRCLA